MLNSHEFSDADLPYDGHEECPDCGSHRTEPLEVGLDDDGVYYDLWRCTECDTKWDAETGRCIFEGSDYSDRMWERRQMGLSNF